MRLRDIERVKVGELWFAMNPEQCGIFCGVTAEQLKDIDYLIGMEKRAKEMRMKMCEDCDRWSEIERMVKENEELRNKIAKLLEERARSLQYAETVIEVVVILVNLLNDLTCALIENADEGGGDENDRRGERRR